MNAQSAAYTFRNHIDGSLHESTFPTLWAALNRAEYDVEENADAAEPVRITTVRASFDREAILALLDTWGDPAIIKREPGDVLLPVGNGDLGGHRERTATAVPA